VKFKNYPLQKQMMLIFASFFIVLTISLFLIFSTFTTHYQDRATQSLHQGLATHLVKTYPDIQIQEHQSQYLDTLFTELMLFGADFEFYILDKAGHVKTWSPVTDVVHQPSVNISKIQDAISASKEDLPLYGADPRRKNQSHIFSVAPIGDALNPSGYLYVIIGGASKAAFQIVQSPQMLWLLLASLVVISLVSFIVLYSVTHKVLIRPFNTLLTAISQADTYICSPAKNHKLGLQRSDRTSTNEFHKAEYYYRRSFSLARHAYQRLRALENSRREMLSHLAHDLRTPLASVTGYLETLDAHKDKIDRPTRDFAVTTALSSAQQLGHLITQIFELAAMDSPKYKIELKPVSVPNFIENIQRKLSPIAKKNQINLKFNSKPETLFVNADKAKLERIFTNLIENGIRHTPALGQVQIKYLVKKDHVIFQIIDTGHGITSKDLPHIFEPHYKSTNNVRGNTQQTGLGLSITQKLLELHKSKIFVASKPGQGSCFQFKLPTCNQNSKA